MSRSAVVKAVNERAQRHAKRERTTYRAKVLKVKPMKLDLLHSTSQLTSKSLQLSQWVRYYDKEFGIEKGDIVLLMKHENDWTVTDVIAKKEV
jgi:hypothetical protein